MGPLIALQELLKKLQALMVRIMRRASGDFPAQHGTAGGSMANIMADKIAESEQGDDSSSEAGNYVSEIDAGWGH